MKNRIIPVKLFPRGGGSSISCKIINKVCKKTFQGLRIAYNGHINGYRNPSLSEMDTFLATSVYCKKAINHSEMGSERWWIFGVMQKCAKYDIYRFQVLCHLASVGEPDPEKCSRSNISEIVFCAYHIRGIMQKRHL